MRPHYVLLFQPESEVSTTAEDCSSEVRSVIYLSPLNRSSFINTKTFIFLSIFSRQTFSHFLLELLILKQLFILIKHIFFSDYQDKNYLFIYYIFVLSRISHIICTKTIYLFILIKHIFFSIYQYKNILFINLFILTKQIFSSKY